MDERQLSSLVICTSCANQPVLFVQTAISALTSIKRSSCHAPFVRANSGLHVRSAHVCSLGCQVTSGNFMASACTLHPHGFLLPFMQQQSQDSQPTAQVRSQVVCGRTVGGYAARRLGRTDVDVVALNLCSSTRHGAALRMPRGVRAAGMRPAATVLTIMAMQHFQARDVKLAKPVPILGLFLLNCDWRDSHACNTFPFTSSNQVTMPQVMQAILLLSHPPEGMQSQQLTHTSLNTPLPPTSQSPKHSLRHCKSQLPPVVLNTRLCGIKHMRHIGPETFTELCSFANRYAQPCSSQASSAYRPSVFAPHPLAFLAIFTNSRLRCLSSHKTHKLPALPMVSAPFFP